MKKLIGIALVACVVVACSKDKFKTQPQIHIESYNTTVVQNGQDLVIDLKFTDKEGDLSGGNFIYVPKRINLRPPPPDAGNYSDTAFSNPFPTFPNNNIGYIQFRLPWSFLHLSDIENDSIYFRFVAVDKNGNQSDTATSDNIVILRQ